MDARTALLALALGPHPARAALLAVDDPVAELRAWWPHREAFGEWPTAPGVAGLLASLERHLRRLEGRGACALLAVEDGYPAALRDWPQAPGVIFCWGELPAQTAVALVGSRGASAAGLRVSRELAGELARAGCCVLSGGAIGVDGAAHEGALAAGGRSVAVLGSGLDHLYPERHLDLFARLAAQGAVLSPFAPWAAPRRWRFPRRNEVMARLARVVVVLEAGATSGALITARHARAAGRPVLARPGSSGADRLLRSGAGVLGSADDVLAVLRGEPPRRLPLLPEVSDERQLVEELRRRGELSVDEVAAALGWGVPRAAGMLIRLQLAGFVELAGGGRYRCAGGEPPADVP